MPEQTRSATRREKILAAALESFASGGYATTTIDDIRARSGASVGSIYHHFGSKEGIARALYVDAISSYQDELLALLDGSDDARSGVGAMAEHFLRWVERHPDLARLMLGVELREVRREAEPDVAQLNRRLAKRFRAWAERTGAGLEHVPADVLLAALFGSVRRYAEQWLDGRTKTPLDRAAVVLAEHAAAGIEDLAR